MQHGVGGYRQEALRVLAGVPVFGLSMGRMPVRVFP